MRAGLKFGFAALLLGSALSMLATGCGDGDNFVAADEPDFTIEGLSRPEFVLELGLVGDRHVTQGQTVILRNSGHGELKINKLEWIARPERLTMDLGSANESCVVDEGCPGDAICMDQSQQCRNVGTPETPIVVPSNQRFDLNFMVLRGEAEVACPQPASSVPLDYQDRYCGELLITTNAKNSAGIVEEGKARIYFLTDGKRGDMRIDPTFIEFASAKPGEAQSATFTLRNQATQPLTVSQIDIQSYTDYFTITPTIPPNQPIVIAGGGSKEFNLTFNPPSNVPVEELNFSTDIVFQSSTIGSTTRKLIVSVTSETGNRPDLVIEPTSLSFADTDEQVITVSNHGHAPGYISSISVRPHAVRPYYRIFYNGADITENFPAQRPTLSRVNQSTGEVSSLDLVVKFSPPGDGASTIGSLEIRHNDESRSHMTEVELLGNTENAAIGRVAPFIFTFAARQGTEERQFVIHNRGTEPLEITEVEVNQVSNEFEVVGGTGTIEPGGLLAATVRYTGAAAEARTGSVRFVSNSVGSEEDMTLALIAQVASQAAVPEPSIEPSFTNRALVGERTTFTLEDASGAGNPGAATWTLLARPSGSTAFVHEVGASASFTPDAVGNYRIAVTVPNDNGIDAQAVFDFEASN